MSTKPDYEAAARAMGLSLTGMEWVRAIVDAALGDDPVAFAVAALIAEGGETIWWCVDKQEGHAETMGCYSPRNAPELHQGCGWRLVYGPIPVEEETTT